MKTLLSLGAGEAQVAVIRAAVEAGHRVVTCDSRPHAPGHWLADEAHFIAPSDTTGVAVLVRELKPDGVVGFASELCGVAAARVTTAFGLPGCGLPAAETLSRKDSFRELQVQCGHDAGEWRAFAATERDAAREWAQSLAAPVVVKPVDGTGSLGVCLHVDGYAFPAAWEKALRHSPAQCVLVERQRFSALPQLGGDGVVHEGRLVFLGVGEAVPVRGIEQQGVVGKLFPADIPEATLARLRADLAALLTAAGFRSGGFNFDALVLADGTPWVIEIAPRHGGNRLTEAIGRAWGVDLARVAVDMALGAAPVLPRPPEPPGGHGSLSITAPRRGRWRGVAFSEEILPHVLGHTVSVAPGAEVRPFESAGDSCGNVQLAFPDAATMRRLAPALHAAVRVELEPENDPAP